MKGIECVQDEVLDLTVVVPTYNPDKKLSEKINSLLKRGFHDIIVVNDGSSDGTDKICRGYGDKIKYDLTEIAPDFYEMDSQEVYYEGEEPRYIQTSDFYHEGNKKFVVVMPCL